MAISVNGIIQQKEAAGGAREKRELHKETSMLSEFLRESQSTPQSRGDSDCARVCIATIALEEGR